MCDDKTGREKYWSELDQQGQIDRMRGIVKVLQDELRHLRKLMFKLRDHGHSEYNGKVLVSLDHFSGPEISGGTRSGEGKYEVFF